MGEGQRENAASDNPETNPPPVASETAIGPSEGDYKETIEGLEARLKEAEGQIEAYKADLKIKTAEVEALTQARDSLTQANAAIQGKYEAQEARIAAQAQEIEGQRQQIEHLIVSNNMLSITLNREQAARLLAEAKKPTLRERIKALLRGKKADTVPVNTSEAVDIEPQSDTETAEGDPQPVEE